MVTTVRVIEVDGETADALYELQRWLIRVEEAISDHPGDPAASFFTRSADAIGTVVSAHQLAGMDFSKKAAS